MIGNNTFYHTLVDFSDKCGMYVPCVRVFVDRTQNFEGLSSDKGIIPVNYYYNLARVTHLVGPIVQIPYHIHPLKIMHNFHPIFYFIRTVFYELIDESGRLIIGTVININNMEVRIVQSLQALKILFILVF